LTEVMKSNIIIVTYLVWPRQQEYRPGGPAGLGGLIYEKAHPCISQLINTLKCVDDGRINCSLVQQVPSRYDYKK